MEPGVQDNVRKHLGPEETVKGHRFGWKSRGSLGTNLKEIVATEHLFVADGWLENPCEKKRRF